MELLLTVLLLMALAGLMVFVAVHAWDYAPARALLLVLATFALINLAQSPAQAQTSERRWLELAEAVFLINLALFNLALLWLFGRLFAPEWWQGRRPIRWISLPFVAMTLLLACDLAARPGLFIARMAIVDGAARPVLAQPLGPWLLRLFLLGYLVHGGLLIASFVRQAQSRRAIGVLLAGFVLTLVFALLSQSGLVTSATGVLTSLPILVSLAVVVLASRLLTPTRAAIDLALQASGDLLAVADRRGVVIHANEAARAAGVGDGQALAQALRSLGVAGERAAELAGRAEAATEQLRIGAQVVALRLAPVCDARGRRRGTLLVGHDTTALEERAAELALRNEEQRRLLDLVATLETPTVALADGVLLAAVVGHLDARRAQALTERLLRDVAAQRSRRVILDLTGVPALDADVARAVVAAGQALGLLGCQVTLSGISAGLAVTLVELGVDLGGLAVARDPQEALAGEPPRPARERAG